MARAIFSAAGKFRHKVSLGGWGCGRGFERRLSLTCHLLTLFLNQPVQIVLLRLQQAILLLQFRDQLVGETEALWYCSLMKVKVQ